MKQASQQSQQQDNPQKQKILFDTNIFSDFSDKNLIIPLSLYLIDLINRGFNFALSDITLYELLRGLSIEKEEKMLNLISSYFRYYVTSEVLVASAQLDNLMKMENINVGGVDHGDKIIGATAILTGSLILTADVRGFPWPYFHEVEYNPLYFQDHNKKTKCHMVGLLRPDFELIKKRFYERP